MSDDFAQHLKSSDRKPRLVFRQQPNWKSQIFSWIKKVKIMLKAFQAGNGNSKNFVEPTHKVKLKWKENNNNFGPLTKWQNPSTIVPTRTSKQQQHVFIIPESSFESLEAFLGLMFLLLKQENDLSYNQ